MAVLQQLLADLGIAIRDPAVWPSIVLALVLGLACLVVGVTLCRLVGWLRRGTPLGEVIGVGLSVGLIAMSAWWSALRSFGGSAFTPVAIAFGAVVVLAVIDTWGSGRRSDTTLAPTPTEPNADSAHRRRHTAVVGLCAGAFVVATALLYGATLSPSPRDGMQPVEYNDMAYYGMLGRDLAATGEETVMSVAGFDDIDGQSGQSWYHWGELWLAAAVIQLFGVAPLAARYLIVLPLVLLAAASLTGAVARRFTSTNSTVVFLFGFSTCLVLAPVALSGEPFFASWASGMLFSITIYGLAALAVLLVLYAFAVVRDGKSGWPLAIFVGTAIAYVVPAHLAVAVLGAVGVCAAGAVRLSRWISEDRRESLLSVSWLRIWTVGIVLVVLTVAWGAITRHSLGGLGGGEGLVDPFNATWQASTLSTVIGAGVFLAIAVAVPIVWRPERRKAELFLGTLAVLVAGAVTWGARIAEFTMFYVYFAGIAVIAAPVATIAVRSLWEWLSDSGHRRLALAVVVVCVLQLELGTATALRRLHHFGANVFEPIPVSLLTAIRSLPPDAKLAYACSPLEETSMGVPQLGSIDVHTGRRIIPVCFNAEILSSLNGAPQSPYVPNLYFLDAPQRELFSRPGSSPSAAAITRWLAAHGITHLYVDEMHPNRLSPSARVVAEDGEASILQLP